jgi:hypothetical protein
MDAFLLIPCAAALTPIVIVVTVMRYRLRQTEARYSLLLQLADKGVVLPEEWLFEPRTVFSERRRALVLMGGGLGLIAMFCALPFRFDNGSSVGQLWGLGLLPLITGLGYLASWWLNRRGPLNG